MSTPRLPHVQSLIGLARSNGIDVRQTLLRILVDQFVAEPHHSAAEITRFGELALHLIVKADEDDRAIIAAKLADHPQTPTAVARKLATDTIRVAFPILSRSMALSDDDMFLAVRSGDAERALAVASRADLGLAALVALEDMDDPRVAAALTARLSGPPLVATATPAAAKVSDVGRRFLDATPDARESIIAGLALETSGGAGFPISGAETGQSIELAALSRRPGALADALAQDLRIDAATARRIADDEAGEPLVVAARALDLGREAATRILLFAHAAVGTSVGRVYGLTALYDAMPRVVALALVQSWRDAAALPTTAQRHGRHVPVHALDGSERTGARQAASPVGRPAQRMASPLRPASLRLKDS
ncbi:hypothetical protein [Phreatobacter stygius]|uniref:DUF2336 domain-containing protein n=1 Tax=Phreatobacter stygius TaxID=1940610 RepID=A0A4D7BF53_9HYPH|nr:hypothetical protein [Phreatobacter stygius]QCI66517.1 hypothetical protein E8M01_21165 [Phreatobacter stygius]